MGVVAACGLVYQLAIGTVCTYLAGNSTLQFSITIGLFMSSYGLGSFASSWVRHRLLDVFIMSELVIAVLGACAVWALFWTHGLDMGFEFARVGFILGLGTLVGLEVPLLIRMFEAMRQDLRLSVGQMMGFDYLGALVGGLAFPLILLPTFGIIQATFIIALLNVAVGVLVLWVYRDQVTHRRTLWGVSLVAGLLLCVGVHQSDWLEYMAESELYEDTVVYRQQTPYQKIVFTRHREDLRLYLDGALQLAAADEYRYQEALVHPAASRLAKVRRVLILGGGEGLALRELTRYPEIQTIELVDIDPTITRLARSFAPLKALNQDAFEKLPVTIRHEDAFNYVRRVPKEAANRFDLVIIDLPDPHHESLAKLYSIPFYSNLKRHLAPNGLIAAQLGSPFFANRTFWGSVKTMTESGFTVRPYHVNVPSFGEWGFVLAAQDRIPNVPVRSIQGRFISPRVDPTLFVFSKDLNARESVEATTLTRPRVVEYFTRDWRRWN